MQCSKSSLSNWTPRLSEVCKTQTRRAYGLLILIDLPDLGSPSTDVTVTTPEIDLSQLDLGFSGFDVDLSF